MGRSHEGYDDVRGVIVQTASELFTKTGIQGTSLNDIAKEAALSKGTLYYYYPTKDALVMDVAQLHADFVTGTLFAWVEQLTRECDMSEALQRLIDALLADEHQLKLHIVLSAESCLDNNALASFMEELRKQWDVVLEVGSLKVQSQSARKLRERSDTFFTLLTGFMLRGSKGDRSELVRLMLE